MRTDGFGYGGYQTSLLFDSLLAKVIGHSPSANFADAIARTSRALSEFRIEGVETNIPLLQSILAHPDFAAGDIHTRFVDQEMGSARDCQYPASALRRAGRRSGWSRGFAVGGWLCRRAGRGQLGPRLPCSTMTSR